MPPWEVEATPAWLNLALLAVATLLIWFSGTRLAHYADEIARRTGFGEVFVGLLLLALVTSLPEIAVTVAAAARDNALLAANNLLGGIGLRTTILAFADLLALRGALTFFSPRPVLLIQAALVIALLGLALAAIAGGELGSAGGVGLWSVLLFVAYLGVLQQTREYQRSERWQAIESPEEESRLNRQQEAKERDLAQTRKQRGTMSSVQLYGFFAALSLVILGAGWSVARLSEVVAVQTGIGQSFAGATLVAFSTSVPELSTTVGACRLGNYSMAFSTIFGSNALMVGLLFVGDIFYRPGPILESLDAASQFSAALAIVLTAVYLWGLLERRDKTILRMGIDSILVLVVYLGGLPVLYSLSR